MNYMSQIREEIRTIEPVATPETIKRILAVLDEYIEHIDELERW